MDNKNLNPGETKAPSSVQSVNDRSDLATLKQQWPANSAEGLCLKRYGDREHFLKFFNPGMQNYFCQPRFYDYIFCGGAPELGVVERAYGRPCLESWLMIQLADLFEFFSSQDALTTQQLEQAAGLIANQFSRMKISEFMYFLQRVKAGCYGHFYGHPNLLHITVALQDFRNYADRCADAIERERKFRAL